MQLEFIGADHEVTGSCHYIKVGNKNILIDCGMKQGRELYKSVEIPVSAANIDYVFLTHAHIDHSGLLPKLYRRRRRSTGQKRAGRRGRTSSPSPLRQRPSTRWSRPRA